ncbi:P-loop containing nucleoside triphosphate hydrolase protein [Obelidium mucronatum]|nr:P-loop containing nucleoside triphosphate hydrolase protein [Obelidium mucronatum]
MASDDDDNVAIRGKKRQSEAFVKILPSYILGSILKITLTNFVTYNHVEFRPGPSLNMVIGPNGTGKSTIVCAIALGLGGKPDILGRAKELKEFVKKNQNEATIEIELKTKDGSVIVERSFKQNSNTSTWKLDCEKQVKECIQKLNIQVDNLCQFLPQDKVSEFANLKPESLLVETERAAGDPSLLANHTKLIDLGKKLTELEKTFETDTETLASLQKKQDALQEQVTRLREREKHLQEAKLLQMAIPLRAYDKLKEEFNAIKEKKDQIEKLKRECEEKVKPVGALVARLKMGASKAKDDCREALRTCDQDGLRIVNRVAKDIEASEERERTHEKSVRTAKKLVTDNETRVNQAAATKDQIHRELEQLRLDLERRGLLSGNSSNMENSPEVLEIQQRLQQNLAEINESSRNAQEMLDIKGTRQECCFSGQDHNLQFEKPVFEPICMGINPVAPEYARALEHFIGYGRLTSFVTQTENDYLKLRDYFYDTMKLRVNVVCVQNIRSKFESSLSEQEIARLGFDGVLINYVTGDPVLLSALMQYTPLHETPISFRNPKFNFHRVDNQSSVKNYVQGDYAYNVKGAYGSKSTKSENLKDSQFLKLSVDTERIATLSRNLEQFQTRKADTEAHYKSLEAKEAIIRDRDQELRKLRSELVNKKKDLLNQKRVYDRKAAELDVATNRWESNKIELENAKQRLETVSSQKNKFVHERVKLNLEYAKQQLHVCKLFDQVVGSTLKKIQLEAEYADANLVETNARDQNIEINNAYEKIKAEYDSIRAEAREALERAKSAVPANTSEEDRKEVIKLKETKSLDELQVALAQAKARADLLGNTDASIIVQFERRQKEIENMKEKHEEKEEKIAQDRATIVKIKTVWEPELRILIDRINEQFSLSLQSIGCDGEVKLAKDEDYAMWRIEIFERSVTTITYLMALQRLSKAPFRVVDEINQGMDPKNERAVHKQMVEVACQEGSSQYFLITPKLLPDLDYHSKMKVLTIFNGDHQPERFDIEGFIEKKRRMA